MGSAAAASITNSMIQESFNELEKQRELIANCTLLWKELSDHFSSLEKDLEIKSQNLRSKRQTLDLSTQQTLDSLYQREKSIDHSVDLAISKVEEHHKAAVIALAAEAVEDDDLVSKVRSLCAKMDSEGFLNLVISKRKEVETLRNELPLAFESCIDPARFVLDAIAGVFPVDRRAVKSPADLGWACVLILEALVSALADPGLGTKRLMVTRIVKEKAKEMADEWKQGFGGVESAKPTDVHAFLQHLATFGVGAKEDKGFYRRLIMSFAWRRQMPKLAISLGLEDQIADMIQELISKGHQLDAINFVYEAGLQDKFPPVPLLKSFLKESKKASTPVSEDRNNSGQATSNPSRKQQSALRAVIKCIEDRKLEAEFPVEPLQKRLENIEKAKAEKKKPAGGNSPVNAPANKRTRGNNVGPMPPAKAGRLINNAYVSSFPAAPTFIRSPTHTTYSAPVHPYPYDRPVAHGVYGNRSPPAIRDPYAYPTEEVAPPAIGVAYSSPPMTYPHYGAYGNGLAPGYQQAYYR
ncbi:uncharacterized protein A4U43_C03F5070 [Asparagus officinalis]|uniref:FRIGIDA-like protein n=1 Tax=Asparagus officinalis TaxID=4686 RepID=A0A5P1F866_ASPOF|nr:FRIGIDA-like protein 4a [Asparagus officinalis]ONK74324.1 uncharacterized protein A4U43_C03F5070 [Asparagus officinalis]